MTTPHTRIIVFDFEKKEEREISSHELSKAYQQGMSCWIDLDLSASTEAQTLLSVLGISPIVIENVMLEPISARCDIYEECLYTTITDVGYHEGVFTFSHVDLLIGDRFLFTLHRGPVAFLERAHIHYRSFFYQFAKTLGFLLFELWDHIIDDYRKGLRLVEIEVENIQSSIFTEIDDRIFMKVSKLAQTLLLLRRNILANRDVLHEWVARRSIFISESTRPYLSNMVVTLDHLGSDFTVERETLAETLTLYFGIVSHSTSRLLRRLTVISILFLPLTFLTGVYGMNFEHMPELGWIYGYPYFWGIVLVTVAGLVWFMKHKRWL